MKKIILTTLLISTLSGFEAEAIKWKKLKEEVKQVTQDVKKNVNHQLKDEGSTTRSAVSVVQTAASDVAANVRHQVNDSHSTTHRVARDLKANIKHQLDNKDSTLNRILTDLSNNLTHQVSDEGSTLNEALDKFEATADQLVANVKHQFADDASTFHDIEAAIKQAAQNVKRQLLDENSMTRQKIDHIFTREHDDGATMQDIVNEALIEQVRQAPAS